MQSGLKQECAGCLSPSRLAFCEWFGGFGETTDSSARLSAGLSGRSKVMRWTLGRQTLNLFRGNGTWFGMGQATETYVWFPKPDIGFHFPTKINFQILTCAQSQSTSAVAVPTFTNNMTFTRSGDHF